MGDAPPRARNAASRAEHSLGFRDMHEALFESDRNDKVIVLGVGQGFIYVIELDTLGRIIYFDRLQTGDVT